MTERRARRTRCGPGDTVRVYSGRDINDLGYDLTSMGDLNGDGVPDIALTARNSQVPSIGCYGRCGTVRLYSGADGSLLYHLTGERVATSFGGTIARVGEIDGNGLDDFAVGAGYDGADQRGAVHFFTTHAPFQYPHPRVLGFVETLTLETNGGVLFTFAMFSLDPQGKVVMTLEQSVFYEG